MLCRPKTVPNGPIRTCGDYPRIKLLSPAACWCLKVLLVTRLVDDPFRVRITCLLIFIALLTLSQSKLPARAENWNINLNNNIDVVLSRRLCAPIASLDCMEEFSGNTGLDLSMNPFMNSFEVCSKFDHSIGRSVSLGSKASLKNVSSTPGDKLLPALAGVMKFLTRFS